MLVKDTLLDQRQVTHIKKAIKRSRKNPYNYIFHQLNQEGPCPSSIPIQKCTSGAPGSRGPRPGQDLPIVGRPAQIMDST